MLTTIVDLQFGSTGKGLIAGYLSEKNHYDAVMSVNMPNAGHTYVRADGSKFMHKVLPSGVFSPRTKYIVLGAGAVFDPERLAQEVRTLREHGVSALVVVHPDAAILLPEHKEAEKARLSKISSTMQGSAAAMVHKINRDPSDSNTVLARLGAGLAEMGLGILTPNYEEWVNIMAECKDILLEGSQGYSLGLNAGFYPYCTSRDCTVWRLIADSGLVGWQGDHINIGTARVHPIRVGNTADGFSGGYYDDQEELTWEGIGQTPELTTVTQRVRRVFSFSEIQIERAIKANRVDSVFLNFCNYDMQEAGRVRRIINKIGAESRANKCMLGFGSGDNDEDIFPDTVKYMGFGPSFSDVVQVG